jgi:hypothetical protein
MVGPRSGGYTEAPPRRPHGRQQTAALADGNRTWDKAPAAADLSGAYVPAGVDAGALYHEVGHDVGFNLRPDQAKAWHDIYATTGRWPTQYEAKNETEAIAESFRRYAQGAPQPDARIDPFFDGLFGLRVG